MHTDQQLFSKIANRLVFLSTKDEFGTSRSKGIENYEELAADLNQNGIVPSRGYWTNDSLTQFLCRVRGRYNIDALLDGCDYEFMGRSAWEYQSYTRIEEVVDTSEQAPKSYSANFTQSYALHEYEPIDGELWREHEIDGVKSEHKQIIRKENFFKKMSANRHSAN